MFIRIIAAPPGDVPEEVRRAWIGLELPLAVGEIGIRTLSSYGILAGPRTLLSILAALLTIRVPIYPGCLVASRDILTSMAVLLTGRSVRLPGYVISAPQALALLSQKAPTVAQWWRECAPYAFEPDRNFLFDAKVCVEVTNNATSQPPTKVGTAPERAVHAGRSEFTGNMVASTLRQIWLRFHKTTTNQLQARPRLLRGLAVISCALVFFVSIADWFATGYEVVGPSVVAVAACLSGMVLAGFILRDWDRQIESRRQLTAPPLINKPNYAAAFFCLGFSILTMMTGIDCLTMPIRLGRPIRDNVDPAAGDQRPGAEPVRFADPYRMRHTIPWERLRNYQCSIAPVSLFVGGLTGVIGLGLFSRKWPAAP